MPRPQRDYNVALRQDIDRIDRKIEALLIERERKERMLLALNSPVTGVSVSSLVAPGQKRKGAKKSRT